MKFLQRFRQPTSIQAVLEREFSSTIVAQCLDGCEASDLIETVSQHRDSDPWRVLERVSDALGIDAAFHIEVPTKRFLAQSGLDVERLRAIHAVIQPTTTSPGYWLAISDPTMIDLPAFRKQGISVALTLGSEIREVWKRFDGATDTSHRALSDQELRTTLARVAHDAHLAGASEVFIGLPNHAGYEFVAGEEKYSGRLHPAVYQQLIHQAGTTPRLVLQVQRGQLRDLYVTMTRSASGPVFCLSWEIAEGEQVVTFPRAVGPKRSVPHDGSVKPERREQERDPLPSQSDDAVASGRRVLLVDDDQRFLLILRKILEAKGWIVDHHEQSEQALEQLTNGSLKPDLIVSDVHMPTLDGGSFLKQLRAQAIDIPVLMLTSDDDRLLEAELALLGADAFVRKQDDPRVLLAWCNNLVVRATQQTRGADGRSVRLEVA